MIHLVTDFGQKLFLRKPPFNWILDVVRPQALCNSLLCEHPMDHQHTCVTSWIDSRPPGLKAPQMAEGQSNGPFICDFDMCAFGDIGNAVIFQCKLWHFVSGSQRKHHLSSPITVFLKSMLFLSSFLWKTRTNAKPLISPLVIRIHGTDFKVLPYVQVILQKRDLLPNVTSFPSPRHTAVVTALTFFMIV